MNITSSNNVRAVCCWRIFCSLLKNWVFFFQIMEGGKLCKSVVVYNALDSSNDVVLRDDRCLFRAHWICRNKCSNMEKKMPSSLFGTGIPNGVFYSYYNATTATHEQVTLKKHTRRKPSLQKTTF